MRLIFLTSRLPWPPNRGDRLRTFNLLKELSKDHEIYLLSFLADMEEGNDIERLTPYCREIHTVFLSKWHSAALVFFNSWRDTPLQVAYYRSKKMSQLIDRIIREKEIQAAYIHLFRMAPYVSQFPGVFRIVDLTDVISQEISRSLPFRSIASRFIYRMEQKRIASYECQVGCWADETWLVSEADRLLLIQECPGTNAFLVPNGVNLAVFPPQDKVPSGNQLIFVGNLNVFHNIDAITFFIQDIFPLIRTCIPDCRFTIIGAGESRKVRRLAQVPGVTLSGFVEDLNHELNEAAIFVAPLRFSAGIQNKVIEAMAAGVPVVATKNVVVGLGARPGDEIVVADKAQDFASKVIDLLQDLQQRAALGKAGRHFVEKQFGWQTAVERMKIIEEKVLENKAN